MHLNPSTRRWAPWLLLTLALLVTALVYWPGLTGGWVFDDYPNIVDNAAIHLTQGHASLAAWINAALSSPASSLHRPLASITFALNWYYGGGDPWPFKLTNVLIHLGNGALLFGLLRELLTLRARRFNASAAQPRADTRLALFVSAAWLLLPINLVAVLYVVQRMESLCQLFVLAGLWSYLRGRRMMLKSVNRAGDWRGLALAAAGLGFGTVLGLTAKESAVLLPAYAFLAEWLVLGFATRARAAANAGVAPRSQDPRIWGLFTLGLFIPATLGGAWLLRSALQASTFAGRSFSLIERLLTEPRVLVDYLQWTLVPDPMVLSLYHDEIVKSTGLLTPWTTLGAICVLAGLLAIAWWLRQRQPLIALGIGWFFAAQLLTATIVPLELVYEQRMYFGSLGVLLAVGVPLLGGLRTKVRWPWLRAALMALMLLWYGAATHVRAREWSNPLRLAVAEAERHPDSPRAVYEAGRLLLIQSNFQPGLALDAAWTYLRQAAAIPGASTLSEQAMIMVADHGRQGDDAAYWNSMVHKLRELPTRQEDISALISLTRCYGAGICVFDVANLQRAYAAALSRPLPIARLYGAYAIFQRDILHDDAQAAEYYRRAVAGAPDEPRYHIDLATLYARDGLRAQAHQQIDALRALNVGGRLDAQIEMLNQLVGAASPPGPVMPTPASSTH